MAKKIWIDRGRILRVFRAELKLTGLLRCRKSYDGCKIVFWRFDAGAGILLRQED